VDVVASPEPQAFGHGEIAREANGKGGKYDVRRDRKGNWTRARSIASNISNIAVPRDCPSLRTRANHPLACLRGNRDDRIKRQGCKSHE
jgi:hypothetical protein